MMIDDVIDAVLQCTVDSLSRRLIFMPGKFPLSLLDVYLA